MGGFHRRGTTVSSSLFLFLPRAYPETRIGDSAKNAFHSNPTNTVFDAKRLIGRKIQEPELQRDMKHWWVHISSCPRFGLIYLF